MANSTSIQFKTSPLWLINQLAAETLKANWINKKQRRIIAAKLLKTLK